MDAPPATPDLVVLHARGRRLMRRYRLYLAGTVVVLVADVVPFVAGGFPKGHDRLFHRLEAFLGCAVVYSLVSFALVVVLSRRTGVYARRGEVGTVRWDGSLRPPRSPVVRFVRHTAVNGFGVGKARFLPVAYGLDAEGRRAVGLSDVIHEPGEVDLFLAVSGLPVEGSGSDSDGVVRLLRRYPPNPEARREARLGLLLTVLTLVAFAAGSIAVVTAVH